MNLIITGDYSLLAYKRDLIIVCIAGAAMAVTYLFLHRGYAAMGAGPTTTIWFAGPILAFAGSFFRDNKPSVFGVLAPILAAVGIYFLIPAGSSLLNGYVLALSMAAVFILNQFAPHVKGVTGITIQLAVASLLVAIYVAFTSGMNFLVPEAGYAPAAFLGLVGSGGVCYLLYSSTTQLPLATTIKLSPVIPLAAMVAGAILAGDSYTTAQLSGFAIIIIGGAIALLSSK